LAAREEQKKEAAKENASQADEKDRAKGMPQSDKPAPATSEEPKK